MYEKKAENCCIVFSDENPNLGLAVVGNTIVGDGSFEVYSRMNNKGEKEIKFTFK